MKLNVPALVLHFEAYYDLHYSLKKLGVARYVKDPRFHAHGLAIMHPDGRTEFRTDVEAAIHALQQQYGAQLEKVLVVLHDACFDAFVLYHKYGVSVPNIVDTLCLSRLVNGPTQQAGLGELAALHGLPPKASLEFMKGAKTPNARQLAKLTKHAVRDVEITRGLLAIYFPLALATPQEITIAAHTVRAFVEKPFMLDLRAVDEGQTLLERHVGNLVAATGHSQAEIAGTNSFKDLMGAALGQTGRKIPLKPGKIGNIPAFAKADEAMVLLLKDGDVAVRQLAEARLVVKSAPAQLKRFEFLTKSAAACGGAYHAELVYHGAHTGRFTGGGGFNIQGLANPGRRPSELEKQVATLLRKAICARRGRHLVAVDASQIECRILAWLAPEPQLNGAFAVGDDIYCRFAAQVFGRDVAITPDDTPDHDLMQALRTVGKTGVLALGYGMGSEAFTQRLKQYPDARQLFAEGVLTDDSCRDIVAQYRQTFPAIPEFWRRGETAFRGAVGGVESTVNGVRFFKVGADVFIQLPSGRRMRYPKASLHVRDRGTDDGAFGPGSSALELAYTDLRKGCEIKLFGGKLTNNIVSGIARDILVGVVIRLEQQGWPVVTHCHDEVVCECPPERVEECRTAAVAAWRTVPAWAPGLVLDAKAKSGRDFADIA